MPKYNRDGNSMSQDSAHYFEQTHSDAKRGRWLDAFLVAIILAFCLLRMHNLLADFPTQSIYADDWSWFTDEGWYSSAALNLHQTGRWVQAGDWSPGIAMPVWPLAASAVFYFTGVNALALRRLDVACSWLTVLLVYLLVRRYGTRRTGLFAAALVGTSAVLFFFSRLALLEEPLMMLTLAAMLLASRTGPRYYVKAVLLGILLGLMMLTKTTAVCLFPAVLYPLLPQCKFRWRGAAGLGFAACMVAGGMYAANRYLLVRPHTAEFHDLWNRYGTSAPGLKLLMHSFLRFFYRGTWADPVLFPLALIAVFSSLLWMRRLFANPLFATAILWCSGVAAFLIYHFYGPPRYFSLLTVPLCILCVLWCNALLAKKRILGLVAAVVIAGGACWNIFYIVDWYSRPEYQYATVSAQIAQIVKAEPGHSRFVLGHGSAQLRLFTDLPGADDYFGPDTLDQRLTDYHPGWLVAWNGNGADDPERFAVVERRYRMVPKGSFAVFHDRVRNHLTLYQLDPR